MKIKNWNKLENLRITICGTDLHIVDVTELDDLYAIRIYDTHLNGHMFDVIMRSTNNNFNIEFEFDNATFDGMNLQNFKTVIKKQDIQTINSFIITINDLIKSKPVLLAYFSLFAELQTEHKKKYQLKQATPSGTHGFPAKNNPISIN
jgi:hypothetical protein